MNTLRIRIELNKGRVGMPFGKLAHVCLEATRFLEMFSTDLALPEHDAWVAEAFENASVDFDVRHGVQIDPTVAEMARQALGMVLGETSGPSEAGQSQAILPTAPDVWASRHQAHPANFGDYRRR